MLLLKWKPAIQFPSVLIKPLATCFALSKTGARSLSPALPANPCSKEAIAAYTLDDSRVEKARYSAF